MVAFLLLIIRIKTLLFISILLIKLYNTENLKIGVIKLKCFSYGRLNLSIDHIETLFYFIYFLVLSVCRKYNKTNNSKSNSFEISVFEKYFNDKIIFIVMYYCKSLF